MVEEEAEQYHAKIVCFGSYRLGAHFPQTDLDLICVLPSYITSDEFFESFKKYLRALEDVSYVLDVIDAKVPILKVKINELNVDLLYASLDPKML
jgi:poly(A) polymerase